MTDKTINPYSEIIRDTEEYKMVCCQCKDEILLYPRISGRSSYTDDEVDCITLKQIILKSARKDERIRELEQKLSQITELADLIVNDNDKPACVHDKECPLNGGDGFDNHCNTTCPFIIVQQIKQIAQGTAN